MKKRLAGFLLIGLVMFACTALLTPQARAQAPGGNGLIVPISGVLSSSVGGASSYAGNLTVTGFQVVNGTLQAVGTATVNLLNSTGGVVQTVTTSGVLGNVTNMTGSCSILTLDIGAIHLDLLGLVVDLNPIHLNITAQSGSGNLLGNLLCSVSNLLNNSGPLNGVAGLLNNILRGL